MKLVQELRDRFGPLVTVENQQTRLPTRRLGTQWLTRLTCALERFRLFQEKVLSGG